MDIETQRLLEENNLFTYLNGWCLYVDNWFFKKKLVLLFPVG